MGEAIVSLPQDMKAVLRIVEDPDLEDDHRALAAGALLHFLSGHNAIPGMRGTLAYVDDVIVLRLVLERLQELAPEVMAQQRVDSPELFEPLEAQMTAVRGYLGELLSVLDKACEGLPSISHHGRTAAECGSDMEAASWLYDTVHAAIVSELDLDEDEITRALRNVAQIRRPLEQRMEST